MSITYYPKDKQGHGAFNGGEITENKPIGFPQDRGELKPYSNLFYWAKAIAHTESTIGIHPHQGFEIASFVLEGAISHYDTKQKQWIDLQAGDVQIIRAGSGISHSERMYKGAIMFQIWFDPNLQQTLNQPASYSDYKSHQFPTTTQGKRHIRHIVGAASPFEMDSPEIEIQEWSFSNDSWKEALNPNKIYSLYVLKGCIQVGNQVLNPDDFCLISQESQITIASPDTAKLFLIASPKSLSYPTYTEILQKRMRY